jgi:hypothetical protein
LLWTSISFEARCTSPSRLDIGTAEAADTAEVAETAEVAGTAALCQAIDTNRTRPGVRMPNLGPTELIIIFGVLLIIGAVVATMLRGQTPKAGQRLLRRWGIKEPTLEQGEAAAGYLSTRRRRYIPIFIGLWILVGIVRAVADVPGDTSWFLLLLGTIIASLLIGEVSAMLRPALRSERSAALIRRGVTDLVPPYGVIAFGSVTLAALFAVVINLFLPGGKGAMGLLLTGLVVVASACCVAVWLSLIRGRLYDDGAVDAALRIRTARVTTSTGLWLVGWIGLTAFERINALAHSGTGAELPPLLTFAETVRYPAATFVFVMCFVAWAMLINPWRKQRLVEAYR